MSPDEMRDFCQSISPYQLQVQVRLKNGSEIFVGKIGGVEAERFQLIVDEQETKLLRYAWVARICNA